ncbi:hypothetical protein PSACC_00589 [Paramicrosporidium saccamoebae]|uniref:Uncharacterized protein n=1 Tax=Paramicrosporidium saccamoebae TaxID=1246581 RepID=A0A2H9TPD4_9FUNG|nr:hypothetical protein PSACC_00589 [Paramicrosporidium saccamoebae]
MNMTMDCDSPVLESDDEFLIVQTKHPIPPLIIYPTLPHHDEDDDERQTADGGMTMSFMAVSACLMAIVLAAAIHRILSTTIVYQTAVCVRDVPTKIVYQPHDPLSCPVATPKPPIPLLQPVRSLVIVHSSLKVRPIRLVGPDLPVGWHSRAPSESIGVSLISSRSLRATGKSMQCWHKCQPMAAGLGGEIGTASTAVARAGERRLSPPLLGGGSCLVPHAPRL